MANDGKAKEKSTPRKKRVSLAEAHPDLEAEWSYERNGALQPQDVTSGSSKKVWWHCRACGYEWEALVNNRANKGSGCPACAGRVPRVGATDVASLFPELMRDWDEGRNAGLDPHQLMRTNNVNVSWKCHACGNVWVTSLVTRTLHDSGCPVCRERERVEKGSLLVERYPDVASEWNFLKNRGIDILTVAQYSDRKVWWRCRECGHEWEARVRNRTNGHTGCPRCAEERLARRMVQSFAEQGGPTLIGVTYDAHSGKVFSGLGRCDCIRVYEAAEDGSGVAMVRDLGCTGLKREGIVRLLNDERITYFITGELGGNAMSSLSVCGSICYYDVEGDAEERARELAAGKLKAAQLKRAKAQRC